MPAVSTPTTYSQRMAVLERTVDHRILTEESREAGNAANRERADQHRPKRERHLLAQAAHAADVLFVRERVDDDAGAQEQAAP